MMSLLILRIIALALEVVSHVLQEKYKRAQRQSDESTGTDDEYH